MESAAKGKVCVTGGTGFVASWLIKKLLENGYSVTTTVRADPEKRKDYSFLTNLPGASEKLQIYQADLHDPNSFAPAIAGCIGVFHLATPIDVDDKEPVESLTRRTIEGTLGILKLSVDSKTVRRVVYTSSAATMQFNHHKVDFLDENCWSDIDYINNIAPLGRSYPISKTLTEKAVLEFSQQYGLEVVTVLPTYVVGPFICPKIPGSVHVILSLILGNESEYGLILKSNMVHVDDVARAHIYLFEHPSASGRYVCSSHIITLEELANFFSAKYPEFQIPSPESLKDVKGYIFTDVSSKKLLDAGFQYKYGIEEMLDGAIESCKEKGYL
ncbi:vestitone reductase-like [Cucumis melo var. makuwa]|uniref:Vestitone reductase-like n=2 Tax=Cucumis melo TaxID=3656 RepID=A0A5D3DLI4_CUCMM|nr:vestitone reductase-like [Cucumis melo]KAA0039998.1 vestitone reductase-like [Cucumis melo var. makuwa]TYK24503.1 vestitone reductase-like [Cucumis melo var. makuwa]